MSLSAIIIEGGPYIQGFSGDRNSGNEGIFRIWHLWPLQSPSLQLHPAYAGVPWKRSRDRGNTCSLEKGEPIYRDNNMSFEVASNHLGCVSASGASYEYLGYERASGASYNHLVALGHLVFLATI